MFLNFLDCFRKVQYSPINFDDVDIDFWEDIGDDDIREGYEEYVRDCDDLYDWFD